MELIILLYGEWCGGLFGWWNSEVLGVWDIIEVVQTHEFWVGSTLAMALLPPQQSKWKNQSPKNHNVLCIIPKQTVTRQPSIPTPKINNSRCWKAKTYLYFGIIVVISSLSIWIILVDAHVHLSYLDFLSRQVPSHCCLHLNDKRQLLHGNASFKMVIV